MIAKTAIYSILIMGISSAGFNLYTSTVKASSEPKTTESGTLTLVANGEDFIRQGFISKDGWQLDFTSVEINLTKVIAYQTEPAFEPEIGVNTDSINYESKIALLDEPQIVDLAVGDNHTEPIVVGQKLTSPGFYNAIAPQQLKMP